MCFYSRYSTAFFFDPDLKCETESLDKFKEFNNTKLTSKTYGEHVLRIFDATYPESNYDFGIKEK